MPKLTGSQSATELLELSFRKTPVRGRTRPWSTGGEDVPQQQHHGKGFLASDGVSEKVLHGELIKTGQMLTGAQRQLMQEREAAAELVQEAKDEAAHAIRLLRERDGRTAAIEAELTYLVEQKELAVASERAKLANTLAEQRRALQEELERVRQDAAAQLEKKRQQQQAVEQEAQALRREVATLRQQLNANKSSMSAETAAEIERRLADEAEKQREERVGHLHRMASRRMGKQGITRGFNAWLDMWLEHKRQRQMLQRAGARLSRPALAAAFFEWIAVYGDTLKERELASTNKELRLEARKREDLEREFEQLRENFDSAVKEEVRACSHPFLSSLQCGACIVADDCN